MMIVMLFYVIISVRYAGVVIMMIMIVIMMIEAIYIMMVIVMLCDILCYVMSCYHLMFRPQSVMLVS